MRRLINGILLACLASGTVQAGTVVFQGTFGADDQVALFNITANAPEVITIQTYGYAGGIVNSTVIPAGGFAPVAFLFDNVGGVQTLDPGACSQVGMDPVTGNCEDLYFQDLEGPGTLTLALAVDDNSPVGDFAADGFVQDGNPGFTCQEAGTSGNFCDLTTGLGDSRTGDYAVAITGADSVTASGTPEPGSMFLLLTGGAMAGLLRRRVCNSRRS